MDNTEDSLEGQARSKPTSKRSRTAQDHSTPGKTRPRSDTKPRKKQVKSKRQSNEAARAQIVAAVIGLIGTIILGLFTYQASLPKPTPIPIIPPAATPSFIQTITELPPTFTELPPPTNTFTPSATSTVFVTPTPTETITPIPQPKLIVLLTATKTSGRAPLKVKFDARETYLTDYSGQRFVCRNGTCYYTWKVYSNGQQIGKSVTDSGGTFDYIFTKQGTYMITVWICRGKNGIDCGGTGAQIMVTR